MLGRLEMSVAECTEAFMRLQHHIFNQQSNTSKGGASYDYGALDGGIKEIISSRGLAAEAPFEMKAQNACRVQVLRSTVSVPGLTVLVLLQQRLWDPPRSS